MREILFRGKTILNKWVYGDLRQGKNCNSSDEDVYIMFLNNTVDREFCNRFVFIETVGQFTGLTDKNGTKIFEGDILKTNSNAYKQKVTHIEFYEGAFSYEDRGDLVPFGDYTYGLSPAEWEVIGNIHDNPELLETE